MPAAIRYDGRDFITADETAESLEARVLDGLRSAAEAGLNSTLFRIDTPDGVAVLNINANVPFVLFDTSGSPVDA
ncbi:hypothetical protein [Pseudoclavibacter helvolus]|uniref:hypothetical protein n=1 Tax=Pseudoclavibacter helvolus TaxID=255205 RepID=UPI003C792B61